jgi:hypothetical protein
MESKILLPCSQEPASCPCPMSDEYNPHIHILFNIIPHPHLSLTSGLFPSWFPIKIRKCLLYLLFVELIYTLCSSGIIVGT